MRHLSPCFWCWEGLGAGGEGDNRGWDGWMASLTRWTWVWVNSGTWWWTGRPGVLLFMGSQSPDTTEQLNWLNWTELIHPRGQRKSVMCPVGANSVPASEQSPGPAQITGVVWLAWSLKTKDIDQSWAWFRRGDWVWGINFKEESMANTWMNSRLRQSPGLNNSVNADPPSSLSKAKW